MRERIKNRDREMVRLINFTVNTRAGMTENRRVIFHNGDSSNDTRSSSEMENSLPVNEYYRRLM